VLHRVLALGFFAACSLPAPAAADWLVSPYVGLRLVANTTFLVGGQTADKDKFTFGSSIGLLTDGVLGVEADIAFVPGFFEGASITEGSSRVTTVMGNVIVAAPLDLVRYGLRPYLVGGGGLLRARARGGPPLDVLIASDLFGMNVGGGALGPISERTSLRFDVRYFRNLHGDQEAIVFAESGVKLSFWRGTVGLTFRF
jgi:hypothetical protein